MSKPKQLFSALAAATFCTTAANAQTELVTNGGFESGFSGWTRADQLGSDGTFFNQTGLASPVNALPVPAPPQGLRAAMTDAQAGGTHVLYQDITIPTAVPQASIRFSLYIGNSATAFSAPASLDFSTPALSQQARVDLITTAADPFSTAAADTLQNLFQTAVGSPLVTGYNNFNLDITSLLAAHAGEIVRLRFAESDNVNVFNFGVDGVSLIVPAPSVGLLALPALLLRGRRRR